MTFCWNWFIFLIPNARFNIEFECLNEDILYMVGQEMTKRWNILLSAKMFSAAFILISKGSVNFP